MEICELVKLLEASVDQCLYCCFVVCIAHPIGSLIPDGPKAADVAELKLPCDRLYIYDYPFSASRSYLLLKVFL